MALSGAIYSGQMVLGIDGSEEVHRIPQNSIITEVSPSDCLVSYPGHSFGESYLSAEMQSVYSAAPADWALDAALLSTQHNKVRIKGKVEQSWEWSCAPKHFGVVAV